MRQVLFHPKTNLYINPTDHKYEFWKVNRSFKNNVLHHTEELVSSLKLDCTDEEMAKWLCSIFGATNALFLNTLKGFLTLCEEVLSNIEPQLGKDEQ